MVAAVTFKRLFSSFIVFFCFFVHSSVALEIIRDEELEKFTKELTSELLIDINLNVEDINFYFINNK